jgi:cytochrome c oxidase subunit III
VKSKAQALPQDVRAMQGIWLFLIALSVFFISSIVLYVVYIALRVAPEAGIRPASFHLPKSFLPSTVLLVGTSVCLEWALRAAKKERGAEVRQATLAAFIMGMLFMVIQSEGMYRLIYAASEAASSKNSAYALAFVLALLHALHVVGGIIGLIQVVFNASRGKYDHERNIGLKFCALYWHFLDIVWVFLIISFMVTSSMVNGR